MRRPGVVPAIAGGLVVAVVLAATARPSKPDVVHPETPLLAAHVDPMTGDPVASWGAVQAFDPARVTLVATGADLRPRGDGTQSPTSFRRLALRDGDYFFGERVELGANERRFGMHGGDGTFALYQDGQRYETYFSLRLAPDFPLSVSNWQVVMQMKQTQPYTNDGGTTPVIALEARQGQWQLINRASQSLWTAPAQTDRWVRFRFDITYSPSATVGRGRVRLQIDDRPNATDFIPQFDSGEIATPTLTAAVDAQRGDGWSLDAGAPIPSHLRIGIYRDPDIAGTTSIDVANVEVYGPDPNYTPPATTSGSTAAP